MEHPKVGVTITWQPSPDVPPRASRPWASGLGPAHSAEAFIIRPTFLLTVGCLGQAAGDPMVRRLRCGPSGHLRPTYGYQAPSQAGLLGSKAPALGVPIRSAFVEASRVRRKLTGSEHR